MVERFRTTPGGDALRHKGSPESHRCGINLAAWYDIGTVEIRFANGSLDDEEVIATVELCLRFVAAVGAGCQISTDWRRFAHELGAPTHGYPRPQPAPRWYRERKWLEDALTPVLAPLAKQLLSEGEFHHLLPLPDGLVVVMEDRDGGHHKYLLQLPATGWQASPLPTGKL